MTTQEFEMQVWPFYLKLEKEFIDTLTYVEFSEDNFSTYSTEYEKLLLSIGSEVDILCKLLCKEIDQTKTRNNIRDYAGVLSGYNNLTTTKVLFQMDRKEYIPFAGWTDSNSPSWWKAYNNVKHDRLENENYKLGNLENVFVALAGLYLLNRFCFKRIKHSSLELSPNPPSQIFSIVGWSVCIPIGNGFYNVLQTNGNMSIMHE